MADMVTLDITTMTLGEAASVELASGMTLQTMLKSTYSRLLLALYVHELRNSGSAPSWSELASRRVLDVSSSISQLQRVETPAK